MSVAELHTTIEALNRMQLSATVDGDIDTEYFDALIQNIYTHSKYLTPQTAQEAKRAIDTISLKIKEHLRKLLVEGHDFPTIKKALSMYNSFHDAPPPIVGFNRNV